MASGSSGSCVRAYKRRCFWSSTFEGQQAWEEDGNNGCVHGTSRFHTVCRKARETEDEMEQDIMKGSSQRTASKSKQTYPEITSSLDA